jgi:hypothetical protein
LRDLTAISLFSGCGGLDIGLGKAGFNFRFQIDSDEDCYQILLLNKGHYWNESKIVHDKIENWKTEDILKEAGLKRGFHDTRALVDVNVHRVLSRLSLGDKQLSKDDADAVFMTLSKYVSASELNYAMIDLAHSVCRKQKPKCLICPIRSWCRYPKLLL